MRRFDQDRWYDAVVPGCVHTDLMRHGLLEDPFVGLNEIEAQWVDKHDWIYRIRFDVADEIFLSRHIKIVFPGLDTYGDVTLNNIPLLHADNMFRTHRVAVKGFLRERDNELTILFKSPIRIGLEKLSRYGIALPAVNDQSELGGLDDKKVSVFSRKSGYHYGWDWGPRLVTSGIIRPVYLETYADSCIQSVKVVTDKITQNSADITAEIVIDTDSAMEVDLSWTEPSTPLALQKRVTLHPGKNTVTWKTTLDHPKLWWCHTHGTPHLYDFSFTLSFEGRLVSQETITTGIRTIELVRKADERGSSFFFRLNGTPIFAKGANYIPNDSFVTRVSRDKYLRTIELSVEANMNMLRIWGGGFYEEDYFYELCDRHGVMVWQDFMFACSLYPDSEDFLANVAAEVIDNVTRLRNHPSIALWCGNNEIDGAWGDDVAGGGWGWRERFDAPTRERLWRGYKAIFHGMLPEILREIDDSRPYWPSSPSADFDERASIAAGSGDIHYWGVWHQNHPFSAFNENIGRFMSEYGFQAMPDPMTVDAFASPADRAIDAKVIVHRQRCPGGTKKILDYMLAELGAARDFAGFIPLSQFLQALAIKAAIEAHRRAMPYCMGSLYWQLNDCWPTMSWSSIDYEMRIKAAHYAAKRAFAPTLLSLTFDNSDTIRAHVVTDQQIGGDATIKLRLLDFAGNDLWRFGGEISIAPAISREVWRGSLAQIADAAPRNKIVLVAELWRDGESLASSHLIFVRPGELVRPATSPQVRVLTDDSGYTLEVTSSEYHYAVWLTVEQTDGDLSDNYFSLLPHQVHRVGWQAARGQKAEIPPKVHAVALLGLLQD